MRKRSAEELARIRAEAVALFDDGQGNLRVDALANPPAGRSVATPKQLLLDDVEA